MTILVDDGHYERLRERARMRGVTLSDEVREALDAHLGQSADGGSWLLELAELFKDVQWKLGPGIDSDEFKEEMARHVDASRATGEKTA
ncbi:MAG: hypothetical protein ACR2HN_03590 [Tepidiformaceae bacterium]